MNQGEYISLVDNLNLLQSFGESTWIINSMKTIQFFNEYRSNTYLVDSRNLNNADLLNQISKSDIFGCYFDIRTIEGNSKINQLVVACSQGVVIFTSFEKESNEVMKNFFSAINSKQCYVRGITSYYKLLHLYNITLNRISNVDTLENYPDFMEFRRQSPFCGFSEAYRAKSKSQSSEKNNLVLECLTNAFEAACIDYYFTNLNKKGNSMNTTSFNTDLRSQPSFPPGMNIPPNLDYPPGISPQPRQLSPKSFAQPQRFSLEPQHTYQSITPNAQEEASDKTNKQKEKVTFAPISADMLKSNKKKQTEIDKRFWKNLDTLAAILSSTKKIEVEDGKYFCKQCNENFVSYEFLLEHCWNEHKSALE